MFLLIEFWQCRRLFFMSNAKLFLNECVEVVQRQEWHRATYAQHIGIDFRCEIVSLISSSKRIIPGHRKCLMRLEKSLLYMPINEMNLILIKLLLLFSQSEASAQVNLEMTTQRFGFMTKRPHILEMKRQVSSPTPNGTVSTLLLAERVKCNECCCIEEHVIDRQAYKYKES